MALCTCDMQRAMDICCLLLHITTLPGWWALHGMGALTRATLTLVDRARLVAVAHDKRFSHVVAERGPSVRAMGAFIAQHELPWATRCVGGWELEARSPELTRPAEAAAAAAAEDPAPPAHLFAYPLESNFSGARCAPVLALALSFLGCTWCSSAEALHRQRDPSLDAHIS